MSFEIAFAQPLPLHVRSPRRTTAPHCRRRARARAGCRPLATADGTTTAPLPAKLAAMADDLRACDGGMRYARLAALGARLPPPPPHVCVRERRVPGCTSVVHLHADAPLGGVRIVGDSDSAFSRGLLALLALGADGMRVDDFLALRAEDVAVAAGVPAVGATSRVAPLTNILREAQRQLRGDPAHLRPPASSDVDTAVLLSGGVDSAVALRLALREGRKVRAFYLRIWLAEDEAHLGHCPWEEDVRAAQAVCDQAGVQLELVPLQDAYRSHVVEYVMREARAGRTPNPDIMCNSTVKFGAFYRYLGDRYPTVISGHYARVQRDQDGGVVRHRLFRSPDAVKDQTYFLAGLDQAQLGRAHFPLGSMTKEEVRRLATELRLPNANRADSQGVCFLGKLKWTDFLRLHLGVQRGAFMCWESGLQLGIHDGFWFYTLGQRRGIGLPDGPWYVVSKDVARNVVYVSRHYWDGERNAMQRRTFTIAHPTWISGVWPLAVDDELRCQVKTRHGPTLLPAVLRRSAIDEATVVLEQRDKALAPGQFAAFYTDDDECLGCAAIASPFLVPQPPQLSTSAPPLPLPLFAQASA